MRWALSSDYGSTTFEKIHVADGGTIKTENAAVIRFGELSALGYDQLLVSAMSWYFPPTVAMDDNGNPTQTLQTWILTGPRQILDNPNGQPQGAIQSTGSAGAIAFPWPVLVESGSSLTVLCTGISDAAIAFNQLFTQQAWAAAQISAPPEDPV